MEATTFQAHAALAAVELHPLHKEAVSWPYSVSDVFAEPKSFIVKTRMPDEDKRRIEDALEGVESVLMVNYFTAAKEPQSLSGGGNHYVFFVHPSTFSVLHARIGTWRA